jgi:uncharacterized protein
MFARTLACLACFVAALPAGAGTLELPAAIGGSYSVPVRSIKEARFAQTLRQQFDFSCGSAALATLLTFHYGIQVNEQQVFEQMFEHGEQDKIQREGFSMLDMKRFLEAQDFEADGFEAPLDKLADASIPAIVLINQDGYDHFVVVRGLRDGRVLIADPVSGTRALTRAAFEAMWVNKILFVIGNRRDEARFNVDAHWATAPRAPIGTGVATDGLTRLVLPKFGSGDF